MSQNIEGRLENPAREVTFGDLTEGQTVDFTSSLEGWSQAPEAEF